MAKTGGEALKGSLGPVEAVGLSLSVIAPTMGMALNVTLAVGAAGVAAPLGFAVGTVVVGVVGLSFVFFASRVTTAGSGYAYIGQTFGPRAGFLAGWCMVLLYIAGGSGSAALVGDFLRAALDDHGVNLGAWWLPVAVAALVGGTLLAWRDVRLATRLMLVLELSSIAVIVFLGIRILMAVEAQGGLSLAPFHPDPAIGWWGIGYAVVFAVLSFAGFEAAATLAEEAGQPGRTIPIALVGSVVVAGLFFVFASYIQVIGFGLDNMKALAASDAPLNTLALKYGNIHIATVLDLAACVSAISCVLGTLSAGARMLFVLGRGGLSDTLAKVHPRHGTPFVAVGVVSLSMLAGLLAWAPFIGPANYYDNVGTIGVLALIVAYIGVTAAAAVHAVRAGSRLWLVLGSLGTLAMLWPLYNSVYPVPVFPDNLWPYLVAFWIVLGGALVMLRPGIGRPQAT
ncbi:amino acid/polyamine/organocation transporter (APC superfamily) [Ancylobacter aquaticus]|uniref:Amino acid/polyamine/organocation transporter (APC superfamily) n=1 Tax=Ancylobacter aquaticus TaxID=100 RepID=A0A4R1I6K7_ANCAQ|nr:APC family permease [Ancylobacter aquaticus]TCK31004.1 amino acid/polyamine/organocation transporter (APC superfamily) [Ancylobacter aquaticus]